MTIPKLNSFGYLPDGVHDATLSDVRSWANSVPDISRRNQLLGNLDRFLEEVIRPLGNYPIYLAGSFFSDKYIPGDIDFVFDIRDCTDSSVVGSAILTLMGKRHKEIKEKYEIDAYPNIPGNNDFAKFFTYIRQNEVVSKGLGPETRRGVVRIKVW